MSAAGAGEKSTMWQAGLHCNHCHHEYPGLKGPCPKCGKNTAQKTVRLPVSENTCPDCHNAPDEPAMSMRKCENVIHTASAAPGPSAKPLGTCDTTMELCIGEHDGTIPHPRWNTCVHWKPVAESPSGAAPTKLPTDTIGEIDSVNPEFSSQFGMHIDGNFYTFRCIQEIVRAAAPSAEGTPDYRTDDCTQCGRMRVQNNGVCEKCGWDNDLRCWGTTNERAEAGTDAGTPQLRAENAAKSVYALLQLGDHVRLPNTTVAVLTEAFLNFVREAGREAGQGKQ